MRKKWKSSDELAMNLQRLMSASGNLWNKFEIYTCKPNLGIVKKYVLAMTGLELSGTSS